jgi:HEAT repeat protein
MGKASLIVFSRIVNDDNWFERDMGRQELPDNHWYLIRNSIFVLGTLRDPEAVAPLRLRISDNDIRVRREIVTALEKIGGEEAVDLLLLMAEDATHEIRESAVAGIGVIGTAEVVPMLTDLLNRNSSEALKVISVLGKLGGEDARAYLSRILNSEDDLTTISAGRHAKDDLRLAVVKALGAIGDRAAINQIREYRDSLSAAQKFLFKNSPLQRTISEILSKS